MFVDIHTYIHIICTCLYDGGTAPSYVYGVAKLTFSEYEAPRASGAPVE